MRISRKSLFELANDNTAEANRYYKLYIEWCALEEVIRRNRLKAEVRCYYESGSDKYLVGVVFETRLIERD